MNGEQKRAIVLFAPGFEEVEGVTQVDFLRRAGIDVTVVGVGARDVIGSHGVLIHTDIVIDDLPLTPNTDAVVVPGGMPGAKNLAEHPLVQPLIEKIFSSGNLVAAICAAPGVVLGSTDILKGRSFTCYPGFQDRVSEGHFVEQRVVVDGNVITSRGPGTAAEFAEAIIGYLVGNEAALRVHAATLQK